MSSKHATPKLDHWKWKQNSRRSSLRQCQVKYSHFSPRGGSLNPLLHGHHHLHLTVSSVCLRSLIFFPPVLVEQIVDAVKLPLAAENVAIQPPEHSSSGESQAVTAPFVQAIGGVPADLSSRSVMPLDSGVMLSSILSTLSNTGMHSFAVPLFVNTFLPLFPWFCPCPALQLLWARCFLLHHSMLIPPSSCLRISWVPTLSLILCQFYFNLLFWTLGFPQLTQKLSVRLSHVVSSCRFRRPIASQHCWGRIRTAAVLWWSHDPDLNWRHRHLDGGLLNFCDDPHLLFPTSLEGSVPI